MDEPHRKVNDRLRGSVGAVYVVYVRPAENGVPRSELRVSV